MGVIRLYYTILKNYPQCILKLKSQYTLQCEDLMLDMNSLYHPIYVNTFYPEEKKEEKKPYTRKKFLNQPKENPEKSKEITNENTEKSKETPKENPKNYTIYYQNVVKEILYLCKKCNPKRRLFIAIDGVAGTSKMSQQRQRRFQTDPKNNKNEITCGTEMMYNLSNYILDYIKTHKDEFGVKEIIFSGDSVPSEGEHKLIRYISSIKPKGKIIIVSPDADLIFLACGLKRDDQTLIYRENMYTDSKDFYDGYTHYALDINKFLAEITRIISKDKIDDFICVSSMLGNDFIHNIPSLEIYNGGFDEILLILSIMTEKIIVGNTINYNGLLEFLKILSEKEQTLIDRRLTMRSPSSILEANPKLENYRREYYKKYFNGIDIDIICYEYIKALLFVIKYYLDNIPDWWWVYPFNHSPFITDIFNYLNKIKDPKIIFITHKPLSVFEQLLCVLPKFSYDLLPRELQCLMINNNSPIADFYPEKFLFDTDGKINEYEKVILLNNVDITRLREVFKIYNREVNKKDKKRNKKGQIAII